MCVSGVLNSEWNGFCELPAYRWIFVVAVEVYWIIRRLRDAHIVRLFHFRKRLRMVGWCSVLQPWLVRL